ncbi:uridine kinase [Crenobacter sp. SG2303]|uniref:Uridine kinase n=1 Tax=Crenobacter oryzisoli TaxID=3056844 RepID=A0ABT7XMB7_9NEIS|nr:uridine kinase [Crenobacter sp. SG2303]MDN0074938.1 uridine kinase [Crenobacter sp. SG2303]
MSTPFILGVAGGSGSGKSTVTRKVVEAIGTDKVAVIVQDNYYLDQRQLPLEERLRSNYDHPHALDWPLLIQHIGALRGGATIKMPVYDFAAHTRAGQTVAVAPAPVIVIEGIFALYDATLREMMSLKLFVDTDDDVRFIRRLSRDIAERGRTMDNVMEQYQATVRPMHKQFVEPTKHYADVILPHGCNEPAVAMITALLERVMR